MNIRWLLVPALALPFALTACPRDETQGNLTVGQAEEALSEASASSQADALTSDDIDISTNFTIGQAAANAAAELRSFILTELPCANVTLVNATLTVDYGAKSGACSWHGQTFSGQSTVTVASADASNVVVKHTWTNFSNGIISVTGNATVTWSATDSSRHVQHSVTWKRLSDGLTATDTGDVTETALASGISEGFQMDGSRSWNARSGEWDLGIDGVQMRWVDPVPQAGTFSLGTPYGKSVSLSFSRVDSSTIRVTVASGSGSFHFNVTELGEISQSSA
jgi:hypothetical protein